MGVALDEALIKLVAAVIVGAVLPYLASWLVAVYDRLFRDLPYVRGTWKTEYKYPREGGPVVEARETGKVARRGRFATAHMRMEGESSREWYVFTGYSDDGRPTAVAIASTSSQLPGIATG